MTRTLQEFQDKRWGRSAAAEDAAIAGHSGYPDSRAAVASTTDHRAIASVKRGLLGPCVLALFLFVVFSPVFSVDYAQHDDYDFFQQWDRGTWGLAPAYQFMNLVGRQLYNVVAFPLYLLVDDIEDFAIIRFVSVLLLFSIAWSFFGALVRGGVSWCQSFFGAGLMATLPGFQAGATWVTMAPFFCAAWFAMGAGMVLQHASHDRALVSVRNLLVVLCATALLVGALFVYQPWAMLFLAPAGANLLLKPNLTKREVIFVSSMNGLVFVAGVTVYYLAQIGYLTNLFLYRPELEQAYERLGPYRFSISGDLGQRLTSYAADAGLKAAGLWDVYGDGWGAAILFAVVGLSVILRLTGVTPPAETHRAGWTSGILAAGAWMCMTLLTLTPYSVSNATYYPFRVALPTQVLLVFPLVWAVQSFASLLCGRKKCECRRLEAAALGCLLMLGGASAFLNLRHTAAANAFEFAYLRGELMRQLTEFGVSRSLHVILPGKQSYTGVRIVGDEFVFSAAMAPQNVSGMVRGALRSISPDLAVPSITVGDKDEAVGRASAARAVINLSAAVPPSRPYRPYPDIVGSSGSPQHPATKAFDGSTELNDFWEADKFPISVDVRYPFRREVVGYSLSAGETGMRMPASWQLFGLDREGQPDLLDARTAEPWRAGETRRFALSRPVSFPGYRLVFLKGFDPAALRIYEITLDEP